MSKIKEGIKTEIIAFIITIFGFLFSLFLLLIPYLQQIQFSGAISFILFNISVIFLLYSLNIRKFLIRYPIVFIISNLALSLLAIVVNRIWPEQGFLIAGTISYFLGFSVLVILGLLLVETAAKGEPTVSLRNKGIIGFTLLISLFISQIIFNSNIRINQSINIDAFQHLTAIKEIFINGKVNILLSNINDTFTLATYLPIFHYIFGLPISMGSQSSMLVNYRILEIFFSVITIVIIFIGINKISRSKWIALICTILSVFAFESYGAYTTYFLLPQTLTALLGISVIMYSLSEKSINPILQILNGLLLVLSHFFIGPFIVIINSIILISKSYWKPLSKIITVTIILLLVIFFTSDLVSLNITNAIGQIFPDFIARQSELVNLGSLDLLNILFRSFGLISFLLIFSLISSPFSKSTEIKIISVTTLLLLTLITIKFPYASKFLILIHYLSIILLALKAESLIKLNISIKYLITGLLILSLALNLVLSTNSFKYVFENDNRKNYVMNYEYEIAKDINEKLEEDYVVISDPLTMHMIEPFLEGSTSGGLFTQTAIRKQIWVTLNDINDKKNYEILKQSFPNKKIVFVITPRTREWIKKELFIIEGYGNQIWKIDEGSDKTINIIYN